MNIIKTLKGMLGVCASALIVSVLVANTATAQTVTYLHTDQVGSPVLATAENGSVTWTKRYSGYGNESVTAGTNTSQVLGFTSGQFDPAPGLVNLHNRYYDPTIGRFLSPDPVGFQDAEVQSFNRYAYALNNPLRYRDPSGKWGEDAVIATVSIAAGGYSFGKNVQEGNYWWAAVDALGIVHDFVAYAIPIYPGAAGLGIQASRLGSNAARKGSVEIIELSAKEGAQAVASKAPGVWMQVTESMSAKAAAYQRFITGQAIDMAYVVNGVKFDGFLKGVLLDAKSGLKNMVLGQSFRRWFTGKSMINQARRQIAAANGTPIEWHVEHEAVAQAIRELFKKNEIKGIEVIVAPMK
jgi:RHS repeat-associated protein